MGSIGGQVYFPRHFMDLNEAPKGFFPYPKKEVYVPSPTSPTGSMNLCIACDWRSKCDAKVCSCMSYNRKDGISVVFKKLGGTCQPIQHCA